MTGRPYTKNSIRPRADPLTDRPYSKTSVRPQVDPLTDRPPTQKLVYTKDLDAPEKSGFL